jgi:hypothetical protein
MARGMGYPDTNVPPLRISSELYSWWGVRWHYARNAAPVLVIWVLTAVDEMDSANVT